MEFLPPSPRPGPTCNVGLKSAVQLGIFSRDPVPLGPQSALAFPAVSSLLNVDAASSFSKCSYDAHLVLPGAVPMGLWGSPGQAREISRAPAHCTSAAVSQE